ncbi:hypothetical protein Golax_001209 [Gossypium laxum]|uniref:RNase H type-1 domain-containing protein n=1 Tax=Gossypium laxum TaxID=34288 RepID=A0A7J9AWC7_9ROSI|nr:hypothetical protein [Gossypium laxum]
MLGNNKNFYIDSNPLPGMEELVESILTPYDVSLMYKIPIRLQKGPDQLIWHWSSNGLYMVKSGQELAFDLYSNSDSFEVDGPWLRIWNGQFPLKIKDFTWRCLKNFIPTCARQLSYAMVGGSIGLWYCKTSSSLCSNYAAIGVFVKGMVDQVKTTWDLQFIEVFAIKGELWWLGAYRLDNIVIEFDCQRVINALT